MSEPKKKPKKPRDGTNGTTWKKGQSGNPGGRSPRVGPNGETLSELARLHTADALATLVAICNGDVAPKKKDGMPTLIEAKDRIAAANAILDRGWGRPKESVDLDARVEGVGVPIIQIMRYSDDDGAGRAD
jgi:hypothetical protein